MKIFNISRPIFALSIAFSMAGCNLQDLKSPKDKRDHCDDKKEHHSKSHHDGKDDDRDDHSGDDDRDENHDKDEHKCRIPQPSPSPVPAPTVTPQPQGACFIDSFRQPHEAHVPSLDLLFVTDTSGSLDEERAAIADGIVSFVNQLPSKVDFRIGVMLGHGSTSKRSGRLYSHDAKGKNPVLDSATMPIGKIRAHLKNNLLLAPNDYDSDGGEEGLYSLLKALGRPNVTDIQKDGFFRPSAALAVIFISDENDICYQYPAGLQRVYDPDRLELPALKRDCANISPERLISELKALKGEMPVVVSGIVYSDPKTVPTGYGEDELGYGYLDAIRLNKGLTIDIAKGHFDEGLAQIGSHVTSKLTLIDHFKLSQTNVDRTSIRVQVDQRAVSHVYDDAANEVKIEELGQADSLVQISYCQKQPEPAPSPSTEPTANPSPEPTVVPSPEPTVVPSPEPTVAPSPTPSTTPMPLPSPDPSATPCTGPGCGGGVVGV